MAVTKAGDPAKRRHIKRSRPKAPENISRGTGSSDNAAAVPLPAHYHDLEAEDIYAPDPVRPRPADFGRQNFSTLGALYPQLRRPRARSPEPSFGPRNITVHGVVSLCSRMFADMQLCQDGADAYVDRSPSPRLDQSRSFGRSNSPWNFLQEQFGQPVVDVFNPSQETGSSPPTSPLDPTAPVRHHCSDIAALQHCLNALIQYTFTPTRSLPVCPGCHGEDTLRKNKIFPTTTAFASWFRYDFATRRKM